MADGANLAAWVSGVAAVAAWIGAAASWRNVGTASEQLAIARRQEEARQPTLQIDLLDAGTVSDGRRLRHAIRVRITNNSDAANSATSVELVITYRREGLDSSRMRLAAERSAPAVPDQLTPPVELKPRAAVEGTFVFVEPVEILSDARVDHFDLSLDDAYGQTHITGEFSTSTTKL